MMKKLNLSIDQKLNKQELLILKGGTKSASKIHQKHLQVLMS